LYSLLPFFIFFNVGKAGFSLEKNFQYFSTLLVCIFIYGLYMGYGERQFMFDDLINRADNLSYSLLSVMTLVLVLKPKKQNYIIMTIVYIAILFSLKRGAVVAGSVLFIFYIYQNIDSGISKRKLSRIIGVLSVLPLVPYFILKYSEQLFFRFNNDFTGSGRIYIYNNIINIWREGDLISKVFGNGFFSINGGQTYAHSDWFELLHDHGILGIIIFSGVLISLFKERLIIKRFYPALYIPFIATISVIFLKSIYSGTYMTKFDALTYGVVGLIMGSTYYNRQRVLK